MGRFLRRSASVPAGRARYKLDTRSTNISFSCAFMKFMTVHGQFRDFRFVFDNFIVGLGGVALLNVAIAVGRAGQHTHYSALRLMTFTPP